VIGGLKSCGSLLRFGRLDRLNLWPYPLLLADGRRVFAEGTVPDGIVHLVYETVGAPAYGSVGEIERARRSDSVLLGQWSAYR
jgi:hypothetical protein